MNCFVRLDCTLIQTLVCLLIHRLFCNGFLVVLQISTLRDSRATAVKALEQQKEVTQQQQADLNLANQRLRMAKQNIQVSAFAARKKTVIDVCVYWFCWYWLIAFHVSFHECISPLTPKPRENLVLMFWDFCIARNWRQTWTKFYKRKPLWRSSSGRRIGTPPPRTNTRNRTGKSWSPGSRSASSSAPSKAKSLHLSFKLILLLYLKR